MSEYFSTKTYTTDQWLGSKITGDTQYRFVVAADGKISWGPGGNDTADIN